MTMHFATLWEAISDALPDKPALIHGETRRSWRDYDQRAARLATVLSEAGIGHDSKVALYLQNRPEYLEGQYGIFKLRGCSINANYRYTADELIYLLDNADCEAVIFQGSYADRITAIRERLPKLKLLIQVRDGDTPLLEGALDYEQAIAAAAPMPRIARSEDDIYMLYTGGTTGMPKGVMYAVGEFVRRITQLGASFRGLTAPQSVEEAVAMAKKLDQAGASPVALSACPLMHGTGMWVGAIVPHNLGGTAVTLTGSHFDAHELWRTAEKARASDIVIVGDAFAKPMLAALEEAEAQGRRYDLSSVKLVISSGVMWTTPVKEGLLRYGDMTLVDAMGASEGAMGVSVMARNSMNAETARFQRYPTTKLFTDDGREVQPGSGEIGKIANGGLVPLGYYKDPKKSAETFKVIDGVRYSFPGDYAMLDAEGNLILLGRGSVCINTGGEKVYPEEVEEAIKSHPAVYDCLAVGVPDERFGERVTAVVSFRPGQRASSEELIAHAREHIAGYKTPRAIVVVPEVRRAPNGKADYKWARETAREASGVAPA
ncbi:MAG: acyl-CoA synthetase [Pseudomonadota bacterium]